ncbi:MAG TPA: hypothetical protein VF792_00860 [Ktedonobacterales bacterium]
MTADLHKDTDVQTSPGQSESPAEASPPITPPRSRLAAHAGRWAAAIGLVIVGAYLAGVFVPFGSGLDTLVIPFAIVFATTCLVAGWLLRSWWGLITVLVVYVPVAALMRSMFAGSAPGVFTVSFALSIVATAVVMSAIGMAIGMYRIRQRGPTARHTRVTT